MTNISIKLKNSKLHDKLKEYIKIGKICSEELDKIIPEDTSHAIVKEVISFLKESGIAIITKDTKPTTPEKDNEGEFESSSDSVVNSIGNDDPVRMYLKEMGYRLLLTREGEVEVAKRIEESRKQKLFFLIQTPIALREMQDWYDDILTGKKLLREVIDIDATAKVREFHLPFPPSSPAVALFKDGELVHFVERHHIEGRSAEVIGAHLADVFEEHC